MKGEATSSPANMATNKWPESEIKWSVNVANSFFFKIASANAVAKSLEFPVVRLDGGLASATQSHVEPDIPIAFAPRAVEVKQLDAPAI